MEPQHPSQSNNEFAEMAEILAEFNRTDDFGALFLDQANVGGGMASELPDLPLLDTNLTHPPLDYILGSSVEHVPVMNHDRPLLSPSPDRFNVERIPVLNQDRPLLSPSPDGFNPGRTPELVMKPSRDFSDPTVYQNSILNEFKSPATPLHIIDAHKFPFGKKLQLLLEEELRKQNAIEQGLPLEQNVPTQAGNASKNKRPGNIARFDAKTHYLEHDGYELQQPWGNLDPYTLQRTFQYTDDGELTVGQRYSTAQLMDYLWSHPRRQELTLWIQNTPADSKKRYPVPGKSERCRWDCCPVKDGTIHKGFFRVCFDEKSSWHREAAKLNPFHNAGYVHLFCLEKLLDFPLLCKTVTVRPDTRVLKEGKNKMSIIRDHKEMEHIVNHFITHSRPWEGTLHDEDSALWYRFTLCSQLTEYHLQHQSKRVSEVREQRGGNNITIHKGSCDAFALGEVTKERKRPVKRQLKGKRRRSADQEVEDAAEDEFVPDENILSEPSYPTKRPAKRPRRASKSAAGHGYKY